LQILPRLKVDRALVERVNITRNPYASGAVVS